MTPFEVVYGRPAIRIPFHEPGSTSSQEVDKQLKECDSLLQELRFNLTVAQN